MSKVKEGFFKKKACVWHKHVPWGLKQQMTIVWF